MHFVYILKSLVDGGYYYGCTAEIEKRLKSHNFGRVRSTKYRRPLKLHYSESCDSKTAAIKRERFFKSPPGYAWLKAKGII
jgi:putative endonuclease